MSPHPLSFRAVAAVVLVALGAVTSQAQSEAQPDDTQPLTLSQCIQRALARNFDAELGRYDTANAAASVEIARAGFDTVLQASTTRAGSRDEGDTRAASSWSNRIGATQHLVTGADVTVSTSLDRSKRLTNPYNPAYDSDVALTVSQPLLKGAGSAANRSDLDQARVGVARADHVYRGTLMDVVNTTEIAYYTLHFTRRQLEVRQLSLEAAQKLYEENCAKRDVGSVTDLEVVTAQVNLATQQRNVLLAQQSLHNAEDSLRALVGQFELDAPLGTTEFSAAPETTPTIDDSFARAKQAQPEYLALAAKIEQLRIEQAATRRNRLPQLDLSSTLGYNTQRRSASDALDDLPGSDGYNWQVGLELVYPIGSRSARAQLIQANNNLARAQLELRQLEQDILVRTRSSVRAVETDREAVRVAALACELSQKQYELEKTRFSVGKSTPRLVLDAQTDLDDARVSLLSSQVDLLTAFSNLRRLEGRSLEGYENAAPLARVAK